MKIEYKVKVKAKMNVKPNKDTKTNAFFKNPQALKSTEHTFFPDVAN